MSSFCTFFFNNKDIIHLGHLSYFLVVFRTFLIMQQCCIMKVFGQYMRFSFEKIQDFSKFIGLERGEIHIFV